MMEFVRMAEAPHVKAKRPDFRPGDTVKVHVRVLEGDKERLQAFEGIVTRRRASGTRATFTVRRVTYGVGVERTFPLHSPMIDKIELAKQGKVRRAKLYFLRELRGKAARIKEKERALASAAGATTEAAAESK